MTVDNNIISKCFNCGEHKGIYTDYITGTGTRIRCIICNSEILFGNMKTKDAEKRYKEMFSE